MCGRHSLCAVVYAASLVASAAFVGIRDYHHLQKSDRLQSVSTHRLEAEAPAGRAHVKGTHKKVRARVHSLRVLKFEPSQFPSQGALLVVFLQRDVWPFDAEAWHVLPRLDLDGLIS